MLFRSLLQAILAVVLAGFNPFGGKGRIVSVAFALILLQVLSTSMTAFAFSPYAKNLVWGAMLLAVMAVIHYVLRGKQPTRKPKDFSGGATPPTGSFSAAEADLVRRP